MSNHEQQLLNEIAMLEARGGDAVQVEQYRRLVQELSKVQVPPPPPPALPFHPMDHVLEQVGIGQGTMYQNSSGAPVTMADTLVNSVKWHKAAIKVFEFMAAQLDMDLFKDDLEAKQIYQRIIGSGYRQIHLEAQGIFR